MISRELEAPLLTLLSLAHSLVGDLLGIFVRTESILSGL